MKFNHDRQLDSFQDAIDTIISAGFKPIAVTQMCLEDTFVFETDKEAKEAYNLLEEGQNVVDGWWYGKEEFLGSVADYESDPDSSKVLIYWL